MDTDLGTNDYRNIITAVTGTSGAGGFGTAKIIAWVIFGAIEIAAVLRYDDDPGKNLKSCLKELGVYRGGSYA